MTRRGNRSAHAEQRRWLSRFISFWAHRDQELAESTNRIAPEEQRVAVLQNFKFDTLQIGDTYLQGVVLSDSRGRGELQRIGRLTRKMEPEQSDPKGRHGIHHSPPLPVHQPQAHPLPGEFWIAFLIGAFAFFVTLQKEDDNDELTASKRKMSNTRMLTLRERISELWLP